MKYQAYQLTILLESEQQYQLEQKIIFSILDSWTKK